MKKTNTEDKKKKKEVEEVIEDTTEIEEEIKEEKTKKAEKKPVKKDEPKEEKKTTKKEEKQELFLEKDYHGLKVFLSFVVIILLLGLVGFLYYKKVYSNPLVTFTKSLSNYQKKLSDDYKNNNYNKVNATLELNISTNNEENKNGANVLNNIVNNISLVNDKNNTYIEMNTKYNKDSFINLKLYSKEENNKNYSYIKIDNYYDKYLKHENKYLQHISLIRLLHEDDLKSVINIIEDALSKKDFTRSYEVIDGKKLSKNTLTINSNDYEKIVTEIIKEIKNNKNLMNKLNNYYEDIGSKLDYYLEEVKKEAKDLVISTYNKRNLTQDLVMIEYQYGDKNIVLELNDNKTEITYTKNNRETNVKITKNNKASYNVLLNYNKDENQYRFELIITLDKTNDIPTITISDDMSIKELNKNTLPEIINEVSNESLKAILKLLQK